MKQERKKKEARAFKWRYKCIRKERRKGRKKGETVWRLRGREE